MVYFGVLVSGGRKTAKPMLNAQRLRIGYICIIAHKQITTTVGKRHTPSAKCWMVEGGDPTGKTSIESTDSYAVFTTWITVILMGIGAYWWLHG